ncbi:MAG: FAD-binding oxidoreductase [Deltaproteobacteria bacterium]|nr:FAD-binding oxidoreductase [Deltaproteobacteria bacterium]MBW2447992.1 FAD-binding oxidoreductase [Deltaproteobacteria bacterium]
MSQVVERLREGLGDRVKVDEATRDAHRRDWWVLSELQDLQGRGPERPLAVVEPQSVEEVSRTLTICREARTHVVTYGGGSGVCGGIRSEAGDVILSTAGLSGLVDVDDHNLTATFRAGTNGLAAEEEIQSHGLTIGHWPQSIGLASVGGLVATRSAGQFSTAYGNIEDMILDLEVVLPDGQVLRTRRTPRASAGPDLRHLFLGSEGTLGVITEATFSLRPLPEASRGQAFHFTDLDAGVEGIRRILRDGFRPAVVRLYDAKESGRNFPDDCPDGRSFLILLHEGPEELVAAQIAGVAKRCAEIGGTEANAATVDHWLGERNNVPGFDVFLEKGIILDTIEIASTWEHVAPIYRAAIAGLEKVDGILSASAHTSHAYRSGTNLYFTFLARPAEREAMEATYHACWRSVLDAVVAGGGGIAHHHGIGRVRSGRLVEEVGPVGIDLLRTVKRALDPDDLLNPGALLPASTAGA